MKSHLTSPNYHLLSLEEIRKIPFGKKPTLLLHDCCGPCACFPLTFLCKYFDVTIYYANSNIFPKTEYDKRLGEVKHLLQYLKEVWHYEVKLVVPTYEHETYMQDLKPFASLPEGGFRCFLCYRKRMEESYQYADAHHFDYFTTVMTVSRQKSSLIMNQIGEELSSHHKTKYFFSDFKKDDGINKGVALRNQIGLYCQRYCGCEYSLNEAKDHPEKP